MFVILKPDADVRLWLDHLRPYGPLTLYPRLKNEDWAKRFYTHIPDSAKDRNAKFIASGWMLGVELNIGTLKYYDVAIRLRLLRDIDPNCKERNNIHVPDNSIHDEIGKGLYLDS